MPIPAPVWNGDVPVVPKELHFMGQCFPNQLLKVQHPEQP